MSLLGAITPITGAVKEIGGAINGLTGGLGGLLPSDGPNSMGPTDTGNYRPVSVVVNTTGGLQGIADILNVMNQGPTVNGGLGVWAPSAYDGGSINRPDSPGILTAQAGGVPVLLIAGVGVLALVLLLRKKKAG